MTDGDGSFSRLLRSKLHKVELAIGTLTERSILVFYLNSFYDEKMNENAKILSAFENRLRAGFV